MKFYHLITHREWEELQSYTSDSLSYEQTLSALKFSYLNQDNIKQVAFRYNNEIDEIVRYCTKNQDFCKNLYPTLEKLGLYYGNNTYNKDDVRFKAALKEALSSERTILLEKSIESNSGIISPLNNFLTLPTDRTPRKLTPEEIRTQELKFYDEENWIELSVDNLPNQPFTLFRSNNQKVIYQGKLDSKGHAYVKLDADIKLVDVVFDKQTEDRSWYLDVPLQVIGGLRDAAQNTIDFMWDGSLWNPTSPLFISRIYEEIISDKPIGQATNPIQIPGISQPDTIVGTLTRGVSQFLTGFIPTQKAIKFIKPLQKMGSWGKGMIAGSVTDFVIFNPHEQRLSNLI